MECFANLIELTMCTPSVSLHNQLLAYGHHTETRDGL